MNNEIHGVAIRIAQPHVEVIRKGFKKAFDSADIVERFFHSHTTDSKITNDQARQWATTFITPSKTALTAALSPLYADGWVLGQATGKWALERARLHKGITATSVVNWDTWQPGNKAAAALLQPPQGLQKLLDARGITIQGVTDTKLSRIGTVLGDALAQGIAPKQVSILIDQVVDDPSQALTIANTEMSRALVQSNLSLYQDSNVPMLEYLVADPDDECLSNLDASPILIDDSWPEGDPPVHPNCMCDIAPYYPTDN